MGHVGRKVGEVAVPDVSGCAGTRRTAFNGAALPKCLWGSCQWQMFQGLKGP